MAQQLQLRRGNSTTWTSNNPILAQGEIGIELDTSKLKIGDGITEWNSLSYYSTIVDIIAHDDTTGKNDNTEFLHITQLEKNNFDTPSGGGFIANVYFRTDDSDVVGYKRIDYDNELTPTELAITLKQTDGQVLLQQYLYDDALGTTTLDAGVYIRNCRAKVSSVNKETYLIFQAFVRHADNTETILFTSQSPEINNTVYDTLRHENNQSAFTVLETDRFGLRIFAQTTREVNVTINTIVGGENASYFSTPVGLRHDLLRNKNDNPLFQHSTETEKAAFAAKQAALVSGTNIKTVNSESLLGGGNIVIEGGGGFFPEKELEIGGEYAGVATDLISDYIKYGGYVLAQDASVIAIKFKHISGDGGTITSEPTIRAKINGTLVGSAVAVTAAYQTITISAGYTAGDTLDLSVVKATGSSPADDSTGLIIEITAS
jgi:hypothetical protein